MIRHPDFRDIVYKIWEFHPLDDSYSARDNLHPEITGETYTVGSLASGETDSEDDALEPVKKILKRKRAAELKQSSPVSLEGEEEKYFPKGILKTSFLDPETPQVI